jgi:hypothetical protein
MIALFSVRLGLSAVRTGHENSSDAAHHQGYDNGALMPELSLVKNHQLINIMDSPTSSQGRLTNVQQQGNLQQQGSINNSSKHANR